MADDDELHHHPHRTKASASGRSSRHGSISQVNVNVSDLDGLLYTGDNLLTTTTTISTIAVQSGEARIVLAVLRVRTRFSSHAGSLTPFIRT